jgi:rhodanese-related sulfurtransferase
MKQLLLITILSIHYVILPAQTIQKLSAEEAYAFLAKSNTDSLLIIDGRSEDMYQSGHLPNAVNIDAYKDNLEDQLAPVTNRGHLFIYCTKSTRSDSIITTLSLMGYKGEIIQISDGITGWKENEFEVILPEPKGQD